MLPALHLFTAAASAIGGVGAPVGIVSGISGHRVSQRIIGHFVLENLGWICPICTAPLRSRAWTLDQRVIELTRILIIEHKAIATIAAGSTALLAALTTLTTLTTLALTTPVRPAATTILHAVIVGRGPIIINGHSARAVSRNSDKAGR